MKPLRSLFAGNLVPLLFLGITLFGIWVGQLRVTGISADILERVFRNMLLALSLIIPIVAGLGLNFGIVLGAMSGQVGLIIVENGEIPNLGGIAVAVICSIPIAILLGYLTGLLFNRTPGREMIAGQAGRDLDTGAFDNHALQRIDPALQAP